MNYINFPQIDPVIFHVWGPVALRWYNLAYILGILGGWFYIGKIIESFPGPISKKDLESLLSYVVAGVLIGGRLGHVLFYEDFSALGFWQIFKVWEGGMSFHGGVWGVMLSLFVFHKVHKISYLRITDLVAGAVPLGIFFGRLANFVNDELFGRVTSVPWAVRFPAGGYLPRHPSQLYEAMLEGLALLLLLYFFIFQKKKIRQVGFISGVFLIGYACARSVSEFFREPDGWIFFMTKGQFLSLILFLSGCVCLLSSLRKQTTKTP